MSKYSDIADELDSIRLVGACNLCWDAASALRKLEARVVELEADIWRVRDAYNELIMAVGMKFPDESRHQTALRYIRQREEGGSVQCAALAGKEGE